MLTNYLLLYAKYRGPTRECNDRGGGYPFCILFFLVEDSRKLGVFSGFRPGLLFTDS